MPEGNRLPAACRRLRSLAPLALALLAGAGLHGCAGSSQQHSSGSSAPSATTVGRDAYTTCYEVLGSGVLLGYLVQYDEPPVPDVVRSLPTGSARLLDLEFRDRGFLTDGGALYRFDEAGEAQHLGNYPQEEALRCFHGVTGAIRLQSLRASVARERARAKS